MRERKRRSASVSRCFFRIVNGPKIMVLQYFNNLFTISDKGNDFHRRAAGGTGEGVDFVDEMNEASPGGAIRGIIDNGSLNRYFRR